MIKVNKHKITIIFFSILIVIGALLYFKVYYQTSDLKYSQEYVVGQNNIKGSVDIDYFLDRGKEFEIGENKYGYAVLKNPKEAFKKLKADYKDGLRIIRKEFNLLPINQLNYKLYGTYGWQITTGSREEIEQAKFISSFIDIYENSFRKN